MGGYHLVYAIYQAGIKQEMRSYLSKHTDTRIGSYLHFALNKGKVLDNRFEWEETNEEFRYNNDLYDVVSVQYTVDSIRICALKDDRENQLAQRLIEVNQNKQNNSSSSTVSVLKFFSLFTVDIKDDSGFPEKKTIVFHSVTESNFITCTFEVNTPPPRC